VVVKTLPKHKKNPEVGEKKTVYASSVLIDQDDALSFEDNEEVYWFSLTHRPYSRAESDHPHGLG
jgi:tRNA synthetases class I (E and Q), anti-codon binding domain